MAEPRRYQSATAFRRAIEDRLKTLSIKERIPLERPPAGQAFRRTALIASRDFLVPHQTSANCGQAKNGAAN